QKDCKERQGSNMKLSSHKLISAIGAIAIALILLTTFVTLSPLSKTSAQTQDRGRHGDQHLRKGPATLIKKDSQPLHRPTNPPQPVTFAMQSTPTSQADTMTTNLASCPQPTLDLKTLVIAADGHEPDLPAIQQALDYLGTPYT